MSDLPINGPRITVSKHILTLYKGKDREPTMHLVPEAGLFVQLKLGSQWMIIYVNPEAETVDIIPIKEMGGTPEDFKKLGVEVDPPGIKKA
jgi:hypothetical protein